MTRRAMQFIDEAGDQPVVPAFVASSSRIGPISRPRPTTPCMAPTTCSRRCARRTERRDPHPVYREFMQHRVSQSFARDEVRNEVIPVYMGLIKQIDDQMGGLFAFLQERGLFDNTLIVFTSDHGDYLGDHWMGEKDLFHEPSVKIPLIIYDPVARCRYGSRNASAMNWSRRSTSCRPSSTRWRRCRRAVASPGRPFAVAVPARRSAAGMARLRHQRIRLFAFADRGEAQRRAARCAPVHDRRQALETDPCDRLPADAVRSPNDPSEFEDRGADPGVGGRAGPADGGAQRMGPAHVAAHDLVRSRSATGAARCSAAAS